MSSTRDASTLREQLAPVAAKLRETRALVQPVSQVVFRLKTKPGVDRLAESVQQILKWMDKRAGRRLPDSAWALESFELAEIGSQRTAAVALTEPRFWAARLDDSDKAIAQRMWITEIGVGAAPEGDVLFGARLICATRGEPQPFSRSIPGFVRGILKGGPSELDGVPVHTDELNVVSTEADVDELVRLLELKARRASVLVFSLPDGSTDPRQTILDAKEVQRETLGAAHVRVLTGPASFHLTDRMGKELSVFRQAVRIYRPGFSRWQDQPTRHPLLLPERITGWQDGGPPSFQRWLVDVALSITLHRADREEELPSFNSVRQLAAQLERDRLKESGGSSAELARLFEEDNEKLRAELEEQKQQYSGLVAMAESERDQAQQVAQEANARRFALQDRIRALEQKLAERGDAVAETPIPATLDGIEEWSRVHLSGAVELHNRAFQGLKKSVFQDPSLIYRALLLLRDRYVPMRREGGSEFVNAFEAAAAELGLENSMVGEALRLYPNDYTIQFGGRPRQTDWHLKSGTSMERTRCFRLYYFWDDETQCVIVGWLPSHLKNALT